MSIVATTNVKPVVTIVNFFITIILYLILVLRDFKTVYPIVDLIYPETEIVE
jgi:hypothetical protein